MLEETIQKDYIAAMKARDTLKAATLNFLRAQIKNARIEKKVDQLTDQEVLAVVRKQVKQRQDALDQYQKAGRSDLADKEAAEKAILEAYLPAQLSEEEVRLIARQVIQDQGASSMKDMGRVMKAVSQRLAGQADNRLVSQIVREILQEG